MPGHWEGDLLFGKRSAAIATLVERTSRFVMLVGLPDGYGAEQVRIAVAKRMAALPGSVRRSLTWDCGKEMSQHVQFTANTGVPIYFCDPASPWQRGTNENTNRLLRQYYPKRCDFSVVTQRQLNKVADEMNGRPRQTLGWLSPSQKFAEAVAMTT